MKTKRKGYHGKGPGSAGGLSARFDPPLPCAGCGEVIANDGAAHVVCSPYSPDLHALYHPACCPCAEPVP